MVFRSLRYWLLLIASGKVGVCRMAAFSFFALTMTIIVSNLSAADLPQDIDRNQLRDGLQDRLKDESLRQRAIEHESMTRPDVSPTVNQPDDSLEVEDKVGPHCFDIKETHVKGHADAVKVPSGYSDLNGSCADASALKQHLEKLNASYA